ncbi:MAG: hypothetical protein AAF823_04315 [Planctomycetota bacterium]
MTARRATPRVAKAAGLGVALLVIAVNLAGCEGLAAAAVVMRDTDIRAVYKLPDRSLAVVVDDPKNQLRDPNATGRVVSNATYYLHLNRSKAGLSADTEIFGVSDLRELQRQTGVDAFAQMPIDAIGRELGADQVIYAEVLSAGARVAGDLYRPNATIEVKIVNSKDGRRIWPNPGGDLTRPGPGHLKAIELEFESSKIRDRSVEFELMRRLAEEVGKEIAQLFYKHRGDEPGDDLPG